MTQFQKGIVLLVISLVLFGCTTPVEHQYQSDYQPDKQPIFVLEEVLTFSQFHQGNFQDLRLVNKPHQQLTIGKMVDTNAKTVKTLSFDDTTKIILMPNTRVKITAFGIELLPNQQQQSHLFVDHKPLHSKSAFRVKTQYVTIAPIGTQIDLKEHQQDVSMTVVEGHAWMTSNTHKWPYKVIKKK
ncbi:hypothetical protein BGP_5431 [Beggiatoa sp. PS]|nr:hypothetical protein BGP_5431 [Beggiatoa sp. PS]